MARRSLLKAVRSPLQHKREMVIKEVLIIHLNELSLTSHLVFKQAMGVHAM